jgi:N-acetylglucosaminyldiphosphoundecaprenol N-acetyl-beta-D-mannosaminyltransferase
MIFEKLIPTEKDVLALVFSALKNNQSLMLTYFNQNCFNIYQEFPVYKNLIDNKFSVYPDGIGIFLFNKFIIGTKTSRIDATELNAKILKELIENKVAVGIIGGNFKYEFIKNQCHINRINFSGYQSGFFSEIQFRQIIEEVKKFNSQIFLIGMGVPKQEIFAEQLTESLGGKIIICIGNYLEYYFGTRRRAPAVFRKLGLEWGYRLINEPARLWKRYLIGIPKFIYRVLKIKLVPKKNLLEKLNH